MDDQRTDREGGDIEHQQMFSDESDYLADDEPTNAGGRALQLGFAIGCVLSLIAAIILAAVIAQMATNSPPDASPHLVRLAFGGIVAIVIGFVFTVRAVVAIGERSKGRFSLLSLLIVATLICAVLGFIGYAMRR